MPGGRGQLPARGSHRSGQAQLGNPAPQTMALLFNGTHCARLAQGEGIGVAQAREALPGHASPPASPTKPFTPQPLRFVSELVQCLEAAGDAVVRIVTPEHATQRRLLVAQFPVPMFSTPLANRPQRSAESVLGRLALDDPSPLPGAAPVVGEPHSPRKTTISHTMRRLRTTSERWSANTRWIRLTIESSTTSPSVTEDPIPIRESGISSTLSSSTSSRAGSKHEDWLRGSRWLRHAELSRSRPMRTMPRVTFRFRVRRTGRVRPRRRRRDRGGRGRRSRRPLRRRDPPLRGR